jgi:SAM-dependent methyltransferase
VTGSVTLATHRAAVVYGAALLGEACLVHGLAAGPRRLPVEAWDGTADAADRDLLAHCAGPTIDVGCGPGRMTEQLASTGVEVLGIDVVGEAVRRTRARGGSALRRDVFGPLPGEGRWGTALLADGNIGIGGDPVRMLRRLRELLAPDGRVVLDLADAGSGVRRFLVTLECGGRRGDPFPWATVGPEALPGLAAEAGFAVLRVEHEHGRWFGVLGRCG